ncbi:DEAD/DEAH box helicase [Motilimonas pumila]|uniref:ATP-dependent RNA helicase RhlE n=1 Tax=Motilimonas pumila TaxID=2303987 RepID=A0A418YC29_9GAMM|nr:DEAD/DEAH box helicase [Motilimonas pumila]RJG42022.1 DEAD/DEAH box helicase [Motilimonas pumila]
MSFNALGLCPQLLQAIEAQGYSTPSPIQQQAIPAIIAGKDVMAAAQTGTGKTAGFTLPLLESLRHKGKANNKQVRALVLTPTRELAAQVAESVANYSKHLPLTSSVVFGGVKINPQISRLKQGCDVLVATPGRLLDLYKQQAVSFKQLEVLVLDEADRMLDMGFIHDIKRILAVLPAQRQNLLFSATFSDDIRKLAKGLVNNPVEISVAPRNTTAKSVEQWVYPVDKSRKSRLLCHLIKSNNWQQVLVFSKTKHGANRLSKTLAAQGLEAAAIHGNKSQGARTKALAGFKDGSIRVLVATDIAARGLDIDQLPQVVNFDLPQVAEDYVHRIGRTGRAGATGQAVSLVCADEIKLLNGIEKLTGGVIERQVISGFEPEHPLPHSHIQQGNKAGNGKAKPRRNQGQAKSNRRHKGAKTGGSEGGHANHGQSRKDQNTGKGPQQSPQGQRPQRGKGKPNSGSQSDNPWANHERTAAKPTPNRRRKPSQATQSQQSNSAPKKPVTFKA